MAAARVLHGAPYDGPDTRAMLVHVAGEATASGGSSWS